MASMRPNPQVNGLPTVLRRSYWGGTCVPAEKAGHDRMAVYWFVSCPAEAGQRRAEFLRQDDL